MKKTIPRRTAEVCDLCQNEHTYLQRCPVCNREFCLACQGLVGGCWVSLAVCRECSKRDDVKRVSDRYAAEITPIIKRRLRALKRLPAKPKKQGS